MGPGWLWLAPRVVVVFALGLTVFLSWDHAPPWAILVFAMFVVALMLWEEQPAKQRETERADQEVQDTENG